VPVTHVFAGFRVSDFDAAQAWYERLLGRPPDMRPHAAEAAWQLTADGWLYVIAAGEQDVAGGAVATLLVDDLDALVTEVQQRGLRCDRIEGVGGGAGRKAIYSDPDGNVIGFGFVQPPRV
jgi:catechol 2,3-dioxygenase-like lactoylglutathione lyase family enzyme